MLTHLGDSRINSELYAAILTRIEEMKYQVFDTRAHISTRGKLRAAGHCHHLRAPLMVTLHARSGLRQLAWVPKRPEYR